MTFDARLYELHLAQERENIDLSFANIIFDPAKHPRLRGRFTSSGNAKFTVSEHKAVMADEIAKMKRGQSITHAGSGVTIHKAANEHFTPEGAKHGQKADLYYYQRPDLDVSRAMVGGTPEQAADHAVAAHRSIMKNHPDMARPPETASKETTREQDGFIERVAAQYGSAQVNHTSPRPGTIQVTARSGKVWLVNENGIPVHEPSAGNQSVKDWVT